jgi:hypothetical protein
MGPGWRLWRFELVDLMAILVTIRRFSGIGVANSRSLRFDSYVLTHNVVRRYTYVLFRRFLGDVRRVQRFLLVLMALWVPILATLCKRAVLMLWHAVMFLGLI